MKLPRHNIWIQIDLVPPMTKCVIKGIENGLSLTTDPKGQGGTNKKQPSEKINRYRKAGWQQWNPTATMVAMFQESEIQYRGRTKYTAIYPPVIQCSKCCKFGHSGTSATPNSQSANSAAGCTGKRSVYLYLEVCIITGWLQSDQSKTDVATARAITAWDLKGAWP